LLHKHHVAKSAPTISTSASTRVPVPTTPNATMRAWADITSAAASVTLRVARGTCRKAYTLGIFPIHLRAEDCSYHDGDDQRGHST
jgi:hypothetical protein